MSDPSLTVVVPVYNEEETLPDFLPSLAAFCAARGWQIILVNDGSVDKSTEILAGFENPPLIEVYRHKINRGYGSALKTGILRVKTDYLVTLDADGQHCMEDIDSLWAAMENSDADMVVGGRVNRKTVDWYRELGKWIIRRITYLLLPVRIRDLNSGFKLYRTAVAQQYINFCPNSMAFSDIITLVLISEGHLVIEHPIEVLPRLKGQSTISSRTAFETLYEVLNIVMLFNPMRIFLPISLGLIAFAVIWGAPILLRGRGVSVGSMLLIVVGVIALFLGLVAEQLSQIRKQLLALRGRANK